MVGIEVQAGLLGVLQGLTEFLPISSSAHLLVLPWLAGWDPIGLTFDVMVHGGTLIALILYFRKDLIGIAVAELERFSNPVRGGGSQGRLLVPFLVGTIPAALLAAGIEDRIDSLRIPEVTAVTLAVFGILLWWAGSTGKGKRAWKSITWRDGLMVGLAQAMALVPGVSRSGVTITAALLIGFSRVDAARFAFLLGIPVIAAATAVKTIELATGGGGVTIGLTPLLIGVLCSFVSGYLCIKYLLKFLANHAFGGFAVYRLGLSFLIVYLLV